MRWTLTGLPLALLGLVYIWLATKILSGQLGIVALACFCIGSSFCALSSSRSVRKVAVAAWCPLLLAVPIGTILGVLAIRLLLDDPEKRQQNRAKVKAMTPDQIRDLVRARAENMLDISGGKLDASIESDLGVPPVDLINFLDDLNLEDGLSVSSDDRGRIDSVDDVVRLVTSRAAETAQ